jgi:hypothetical protein
MLTKAAPECGCARHQVDRDTFQVRTPRVSSAIENWAKQQTTSLPVPKQSAGSSKLLAIETDAISYR